MKTTVSIVNNERGSILIVTLVILVLLTIIGTTAITTTDTEFRIVQNEKTYKTNLYISEGGSYEVALDVDRASPGTQTACGSNDRISCSILYSITDINTPVFLSTTQDGSTLSNPSSTQIGSYTDTAWSKNYETQTNEYAYRVFYKGQGPMPKGYGTNFGSYLYDITVRKQLTDGGAVDDMSTVIGQGFRKIGPKAS